MEIKKHYIAFLDILGFKDLIENNDLKYVIDLYENFEPSLLYSMAFTNLEFRANNLDNNQLPGIDNLPLNSLTISDSILIWTDDCSGKSFIQLINTVHFHLNQAIKFGIPLRGAITLGDLVIKYGKYEKSKKINAFNTILGKPLTHAYVIENQAEWSGCIIDQSCIDFYSDYIQGDEDPADIKTLEKLAYIKKYKVPMKNGSLEEYYTINWTSVGPNRIERQEVREAFSQHNKTVNLWPVENKIRNTLDFYDETEKDYNDFISYMNKKRATTKE